jgi:hypothetical protein
MAFPRGIASLEDAFEQGRIHTQRILKLASATTGARWTDWAFASGQPAYDPRIGTALAFTPQTDFANETIYTGHFPGERHLVSITLRADGGGGPINVVLYDLLGYYPLINGDSSDPQLFDNTQKLPRYTDGAGVLPVLVSSVAPSPVQGTGLMTYTDALGATRTTAPFAVVTSTTAGQIISGPNPASPNTAALNVPLSDGSAYGVRSVAGIQYTSPPSGIQALYLIRPITTFTCNGDRYVATERHFPNYPTVQNGCVLNFFFYQPIAVTTAFFGHLTFAS